MTKTKRKWSINIKKALIVNVQKDFLKDNIVNMEDSLNNP